MKYPYKVKHNGVWYAVGEEVPTDNVKTPVAPAETPVAPVEVEQAVEIPTESIEVPTKAKSSINKTEINRMPINDLKKFAKENGIEKINTKSGAELKKELIAKLGL